MVFSRLPNYDNGSNELPMSYTQKLATGGRQATLYSGAQLSSIPSAIVLSLMTLSMRHHSIHRFVQIGA